MKQWLSLVLTYFTELVFLTSDVHLCSHILEIFFLELPLLCKQAVDICQKEDENFHGKEIYSENKSKSFIIFSYANNLFIYCHSFVINTQSGQNRVNNYRGKKKVMRSSQKIEHFWGNISYSSHVLIQ